MRQTSVLTAGAEGVATLQTSAGLFPPRSSCRASFLPPPPTSPFSLWILFSFYFFLDFCRRVDLGISRRDSPSRDLENDVSGSPKPADETGMIDGVSFVRVIRLHYTSSCASRLCMWLRVCTRSPVSMCACVWVLPPVGWPSRCHLLIPLYPRWRSIYHEIYILRTRHILVSPYQSAFAI